MYLKTENRQRKVGANCMQNASLLQKPNDRRSFFSIFGHWSRVLITFLVVQEEINAHTWATYTLWLGPAAGPSCQEEILLHQVRHFWALFPRGHAKINWSDLFMAFIKNVVYLWAQCCNGQCRVSLALYENDRSEWVSYECTIRNRSFSID